MGTDKTTRTSLDVSLRDVSAGGLSFSASGQVLDKGCAVNVKISIAGRPVNLPGQVVWSQASEKGSLSGIRVHTHLTDSLTRAAFDRWLAAKK